MNKYDKLQSKLMKYQTKIYHITLKYDPTTSVDNYQELSIFWLDNMTTLDKIRRFRIVQKKWCCESSYKLKDFFLGIIYPRIDWMSYEGS